ncbi:MAG: SgcJ/EcaC family oxidoreductase [Bacteroidota bacterium]
MKAIIFLTVLFFSTMTKAQTNNADDAAIRDLVKYLEDGWAKKDGNLFAKPFEENADYVVVNGMYIKGKAAIAGGHQAIFDSFYKETFIKTTVQSIRYIRPDIAIVHVDGVMTGTSYGQKVDTKAKIGLTVEKTATGWQIAAFQNTPVTEQPARTGN